MITVQREELLEFESFAGRLADASAKVTLEFFRSQVDVENKAAGNAFDPVTIADRRAEEVMRDLIEAAYPRHGIIGEEHANKTSDHELTWILDPIDGTRSFIAGVPLWGTLIGLGEMGAPFLGVMDQPYLGERFMGVNTPDRKEAHLIVRGEKQILRTRPCSGLSQAIITCTTPDMFEAGAERAAYEEVEKKCRLARYSLDCYGYALLSMGLFDLVIEANMAPYDIHALIPLVEAAGGIVTDWRGNPPYKGGQIIAAGDPSIHGQALKILKPAAS